jgi:hypothetical protein
MDDGILDMRYNKDVVKTAADIVKYYCELFISLIKKNFILYKKYSIIMVKKCRQRPLLK